jgi:hypothetical protein
MRIATAACAACCALAAAAPAAEGRPRALVAFLPVDVERIDLLSELAARGMTFGLTSPTLGGYSRAQMALDVSQGSRISTRAYDDPLPQLRLLPDGRIAAWDEALDRAEDAPGDVVPGLLAGSIEAAGGHVAYAGALAPRHVEAAAAADRSGRVERVAVGAFSRFTERALALWRRSDLLVARLPPRERGLAALDRLLRARGRDDLVYVVRAPPAGPLRLLETGIAGPGFGGGRLRSDTTRLTGFVSATDVAPTVLDHLGIDLPSKMDGRPIGRRRGGDPGSVRDTSDRFDVLLGRRGALLRAALEAFLVLLAGLALVRGRAGARAALRIALLAAIWLPGLALLTSALRPSRSVEVAVLVLVALALGAATDRALPWPRGPALPAAVVFAAHGIDLAAGSALIDGSLAGPNPKGGARFFGVGNELEVILSALVLLGAGAAVARVRDSRAPRAIAAVCLVAGIVIGAGRLGADVGGVITLGAGAAAAVVAALPGGPSRRAVLLALAVPALAVAALVVLDLATGGGAHLTRSVVDAEGPAGIADIVERRFRISFAGVGKGTAPVSVGVAILLLAGGFLARRRLLAPAADAPGLRAGVIGIFFATVVGSLANDSGPVMVLIGTAALLLAVGYVRGRPGPAAAGVSSTIPPCA